MIRKKIGYLLFLLIFTFGCSGRKEANEVSVRLVQDPESLNPVQYSSVIATQLLSLLYQSLLVIDLASKEYKPLLVKEIPQAEIKGAQSFYTFHLREEATWDNGKPITAADVVFSLKVINCPGLKNQRLKSFFEFIKDIRVYGENPKKFTLVCGKFMPDEILQIEQFALLPEYLVDPQGLLLPYSLKELASSTDSLESRPNIKAFVAWFNSDRFTRNKAFLKGSGGYELEQWETGQYVRFRKKQQWWGDKISTALPYVTAEPQGVNFRIIPDNATALLALRNEQLDVLADVPVAASKQLTTDKAFRENYHLFTPATYDITYIGLNGRTAKLADARTRQALAHLLDVPHILQATQSGFATPTIGPINPSDTPLYNQAIIPYAFNLNKATALLVAAGWEKQGDGWRQKIKGRWEPLELTLNYKAGNSEFESIALIFQQAAAKINIPVTLQPLEGLLLTRKLQAHDFDMFLRYLSGNPFFFNFKPILHTESAAVGGGNYTGFGNPESDRLIDQINQTPDRKAKALLLKRFQQVLHQESNLIFLYFNQDRLAIHKRFTNLKVSGIKPGYDVSAFTLKTGK
jgi:peptide/nickel transport system substrate-binding protein